MYTFIKLHEHSLGQFDEKINQMKIPKSWNFETKGYKRNDSFIKSFG